MCRFNLILINDETAEEILKGEGYTMFYDNISGKRAYQKGYCNCGSVVGSIIEKRDMSYEKAIASLKKEKLERMYQIRELLHQPDYQEKKEHFEHQRDLILKELEPLHEKMFEYEKKLIQEIEDKYQGDEYQKKIAELYQDLENMSKDMELEPELTIKQEEYQTFLRENDIMNDSTIYYLTKEDEEKAHDTGIPLSELLGFGFEEEEEVIEGMEPFELKEIELESRVIDEAIEREENNTYQNHREEYEEYRKLFEQLLEYTPSLIFTTIWSEIKDLKNGKDVDIAFFKIDDLVFLDFDEMIYISK